MMKHHCLLSQLIANTKTYRERENKKSSQNLEKPSVQKVQDTVNIGQNIAFYIKEKKELLERKKRGCSRWSDDNDLNIAFYAVLSYCQWRDSGSRVLIHIDFVV